MSELRCHSCTSSNMETTKNSINGYTCRCCGNSTTDEHILEMKSRTVSDELKLALDKVRWGEHAQSRNPRYHSSISNSQDRLRRAIHAAIESLKREESQHANL